MVIPHYIKIIFSLNSDDIFAMETLPNSMVVIGGGYIGIEIA
jgi:pyruvate/2-oxoglutarate dehydrogenase complex dihydrolipoamide dehydrogenase (E3) component